MFVRYIRDINPTTSTIMIDHPTFLRSPFLVAAAAAVLAVSCLPSSIASDEVVASTLRKSQRFAGRATQRMLDEDALDRVGNNGSPSANYPLKACQGDCDNDDECMVSDTYRNCSSSCVLFYLLILFSFSILSISISLYYLTSSSLGGFDLLSEE